MDLAELLPGATMKPAPAGATPCASIQEALRVLAVDAGLLKHEALLDRVLGWEGTRILAVLPGHRLPQTELRRLEKWFHVVEFLQVPSCTAHLFAALHKLSRKISQGDIETFLYVGPDIGGQELQVALDALRQGEPGAMHGAGGHGTSYLRLGPDILRHPLLPAFMATVDGWHVDDATFCELIREFLPEARS